jgi:hypothetical protein
MAADGDVNTALMSVSRGRIGFILAPPAGGGISIA